MMWVEGPEGGRAQGEGARNRACCTGVAFMPFHFGGHWMGEVLRDKYPEGADPYVLGEASNMVGRTGMIR